MNKVSLIIPTFNRQSDLYQALSSVSEGHRIPDEVIIVEQGDLNKTQEIVKDFSRLPISLYHFNQQSLTMARNFGVSKSSGELISFIDDDVTINPTYIENLAQFFSAHTKVMGVTGKDLLASQYSPTTLLYKIAGVLLWRGSFSKHNRILLSGYNSRAPYGNRETKIEWLSGCSMTYRRTVFDAGIWFDSRLTRWSYGEDAQFSFLVNKQFPHSLKYVPTLIYEHHQSPISRLSRQPAVRMEVIYHYLFWKENILPERPIMARIAYVWFCLGRIVLNIIRSRSLFRTARIFIDAHVFVFRNGNEILSGKCDYNHYILS